MTRLHIYKDRKKEWRWSLIAKNGRILADSAEGYKRLRDCRSIAKRIFPWHTTPGPKVVKGKVVRGEP
jgi:uncharacterized protein YegP (UPF0339 family)